jgi:single-strand DNA-binding protein
MANDLNQCSFIGRLGKDPEVRFLQAGDAVVNMSIAVGWKTKEKEGVEWVPLVAFGKLAEICAEYLKKGSQIYAQGRFRTRKWQDKDGKDRYSTEVVVDTMQMLGRPAGDAGGKPQAAAATAAPASGGEEFNDDIPF